MTVVLIIAGIVWIVGAVVQAIFASCELGVARSGYLREKKAAYFSSAELLRYSKKYAEQRSLLFMAPIWPLRIIPVLQERRRQNIAILKYAREH